MRGLVSLVETSPLLGSPDLSHVICLSQSEFQDKEGSARERGLVPPWVLSFMFCDLS